MGKINLKALDKTAVYRFFEKLNLPRYRADQLLLRLYHKYAVDIDEIREFSKELRDLLRNIADISALTLLRKVTSSDNTEKFLFALEDGQAVECVLIPEQDRLTLCVSSQIGCALRCLFCRTGKSGFVRNLKSYEIVDQILAVNKIIQREYQGDILLKSAISPTAALRKGIRDGFSERKITNVVLMGMGEPLMNFDEVVDALRRMVELLGISRRKITVSTAGIVPKLMLLPKAAPDINLAISLNAATDEVRNTIMPVNRRYPIKSLIDACRKYPLRPGRKITFEYIMMAGVNDSREDALRLVKLLSGIRCTVNLIPLNPFPNCGLKRSRDEMILAFQSILIQHNLKTFIRESRGQDINAACGQLRAREMKHAGVEEDR